MADIIFFECIGFQTNPVFLQINEDLPPKPIGFVRDMYASGGEKQASFAIDLNLDYDTENLVESLVPRILTTYAERFEADGVVLNDVSKEAWLDFRFGESVDKQKT